MRDSGARGSKYSNLQQEEYLLHSVSGIEERGHPTGEILNRGCILRVIISKCEDLKYICKSDIRDYMAGEQGIKMVNSYKELLLDGFPRFGEVLW